MRSQKLLDFVPHSRYVLNYTSKLKILRKVTITIMLDTEQTMLPQNRVNLEEDEIPTQYYNIQADLREPLPPPLDPKTKQPVNPTTLESILVKELIRKEP